MRVFISQAIAEMRGNPRVGNQLMSPQKTKHKDKDKEKDEEYDDESEDEVDEMALAGGGIAGFTAPLGASNLDMGYKPAKPGGRVKKRKKTFVRWK